MVTQHLPIPGCPVTTARFFPDRSAFATYSYILRYSERMRRFFKLFLKIGFGRRSPSLSSLPSSSPGAPSRTSLTLAFKVTCSLGRGLPQKLSWNDKRSLVAALG